MSLTVKLPSSLIIRRSQKHRGVAAMEFALTLPIWITMLLGCTDGGFMMLLSQRVDRIAYSVTDILTQSQQLAAADIDRTMLAAGQLMQPFTFGVKGIVIVTSVTKEAGQPVSICWQYSGGGSLARSSLVGSLGGTVALPNGLTINDNENVLITEVYYDFAPLFINAGVLSAGDIYRVAVYKPRLSQLCQTPS